VPYPPPLPLHGITTTGWIVLCLLALAGLTCVIAGYRALRACDWSRAGRRRWWLVLVVLVALPLGAFGLLAEDVSSAEGISWDLSIMRQVLLHHSDHVRHVMSAVTATGGALVVLVLLGATAATLLIARLRGQALFLVSATAACMIVDAVMKLVFQRARPEVIPHYFIGGYSFPSGHTMNTMGFAVALTIVFWHSRWRWFTAVTSLAWAVSVGVSRVYVGVHFPSDVLGGWTLATAVVSIAWLLFWTELEPDPAAGVPAPTPPLDSGHEPTSRDAVPGPAGTDGPRASSEE